MNIGDDVLYHETKDSEPLAGKVCHVINEDTVTLCCFERDGTTKGYGAVNVVVAGKPLPTARYCEKTKGKRR